MAAKKKAVLFAVNVLSDGFFTHNEDERAYSALIGDYFADCGDKTEGETDNEDGMRYLFNKPPMVSHFIYRASPRLPTN